MVGLKMAVLKRIRLVNFRSHERFELALNPQLTTIVGENGCGKTSVLEAIYEVTQGRSFRAVDREIVRRGAEFYRVELEYEDGRKVVAVYDAEAARKEFLVEDKRTRRLPKKARYPMVLFEPDDLGLIGSSPTRRRAYFDRMLGQLSEAYATALARYNKALKQRNELLKQEVMDAGEMFSWNMLLTQYGAEINRQRMGMTEQINRRLIYGLLAAGVLYFLALGGVLLRNWHHSRLSEENAKILHALGDTYYAIYLIHTGTAQCRMVKPSADVAQAMGSNTSYQRLVDVLAGLMEPDTSGQFRREFDLDNIRSLAARGIRDFGGDFRRKFPNGQYEWVNIQLLLTGTGLDSDEVIFAFRQISHEKLRETQRVRLLEESIMAAQAGNAAKSSFLSNMSHDMRTPLNAIIGFSQLAEKNVHDPGRVTEYLKKIRFSSDHLLQLINDILDMAKIEQGHLTLREEPFSLNSLCRQTAEAFQTQAEAEGKSFFFHCDPGENHVLGDSLRISQVLNNLLSNAVKFTPAGGKIRFELRQTALLNQNAALFQLVVSDTGVGMSPEFLDKLFLPFERETRFHSSQMSGTGLGMPIVKSILQTMNGSIDVATQPGHGTTFTVTLPLKLQQSSSENIAPQETKGADLDLSGANLLVAEDNLLNMEIAVELLTMNGAVVTQATNGQEVLDLFSQSPPGTFQAILMDMQMPVMDGLEATRRIRKLDRPDAGIIPIIAVTANAFPDDVAAILEAGMNAYISKPMDFQKLMETLGQYLS